MKLPIEIDVPAGATHYSGELRDDPTFYKMSMIGVVGEHWWQYSTDRGEWILASYHKPPWTKELPKEVE